MLSNWQATNIALSNSNGGPDLYKAMSGLPAAGPAPSIVQASGFDRGHQQLPSWRSQRKPISTALRLTAYLQNVAETWRASISLGPVLARRSIPSHQMTQKIH